MGKLGGNLGPWRKNDWRTWVDVPVVFPTSETQVEKAERPSKKVEKRERKDLQKKVETGQEKRGGRPPKNIEKRKDLQKKRLNK